MNDFESKCRALFESIGDHKTMVLSTSLHDKVTSRTMSVVLIDREFYFQTDLSFRKYRQIRENPNVALCTDNIQVEGICAEMGFPHDCPEFCGIYKRYFSAAYDMYSGLESERLFAVKPTYIQKWIYEAGNPFVESFDFVKGVYQKIGRSRS